MAVPPPRVVGPVVGRPLPIRVERVGVVINGVVELLRYLKHLAWDVIGDRPRQQCQTAASRDSAHAAVRTMDRLALELVSPDCRRRAQVLERKKLLSRVGPSRIRRV